MDRLIPKQEVMTYLNISRKTFERFVKDYGLPMIKLGYKRYIRENDLNDFLNNHTINKVENTVEVSEPSEEFEWKKIWG
ncbi:helix-turn-helix domain-containing protein [Schleiferiaceae bacterium]|jgi:excisionase family DNA binding protein|nr:helix-turn-helix domain-containing protein [Schleiferiaceae bacterium]MDA9192497.1 helix-turn-helix domain-containing protein [Schleiferiaceae bacterium]|tara:strand:+ start:143 stop:379 length:237 start_codon:yes stop_codon:yes gene_type:complete